MPRREYRAAWVASVANIDWPSKSGLSSDALRTEMIRILDTAQDLKLNALFLHVRPSCDALYQSSLEPWSEFLSGVQGQPPEGTSQAWDPLVEWIDLARARGIEIHAWINPFRARHSAAKTPLAATHIAVRRPDLVRAYDNMLWLDPGEPDAQAHTLRVIDDLVRRYDLAGVHFDDYFYPYPKADQPFPDDAPFTRFQASGGVLSRQDWRRDNINRFVQTVYTQIKAAKPHVRVSISPFGIWRPDHPAGVKGFDAYDQLAADSKLWLEQGWCDMMVPQLYWKISAPKQPYAELLDWWLSNNPKQRLVVAGNYATRINDKPESWQPIEIVNQVIRTRDRGAAGNVHFSMVGLTQNRKGLSDTLREGVYAEPALVPETPWLGGTHAPDAPTITMQSAEGDSVRLTLGAESRCQDGVEVPEDVAVWVVQTRRGGLWETRTLPPGTGSVEIPINSPRGELRSIAVSWTDRAGRLSPPRRVTMPAMRER